VGALVWLEDIDEIYDVIPQPTHSALARFAQHGLGARTPFRSG
jgi:hypothetical protein